MLGLALDQEGLGDVEEVADVGEPLEFEGTHLGRG